MKKIIALALVAAVACSCTIPAFAAEADSAVTVPAEDAVLNLFPAIFESIALLFEAPPITYLLGILLLAFIILAFKMLTHFR